MLKFKMTAHGRYYCCMYHNFRCPTRNVAYEPTSLVVFGIERKSQILKFKMVAQSYHLRLSHVRLLLFAITFSRNLPMNGALLSFAVLEVEKKSNFLIQNGGSMSLDMTVTCMTTVVRLQ